METPVKAIEVHYPKLTCQDRMDGGIDIMIDDFVYVSVNYDYRFTNNAARRALADKIVGLLKA